MPRRFALHSVAAPVRVHSIFGDVADMLFVEANHFWRQGKYSQPVDALMREKSPGMAVKR